MSRDKKFMEMAYNKTFDSDHKFAMSAILVKGNRILSWGNNKEKTHPIQINYDFRCQSLHAEIDALIRAPYEQIKGSTIYVCRRLVNGDYGLAKPCCGCHETLLRYGIKKVVYSITSKECNYDRYFL
jgi:deoxycytidylate deaminase